LAAFTIHRPVDHSTPHQQLEHFVIRVVMSLALALLAFAAVGHAQAPDPQNTLVIETSKGNILIKLRPDLAPKHVAQVKRLAKEGFYNGIIFHRVIVNFMAQTGDPTGTGAGGSKLPNLPAEFTKEEYKRGSVGAARTDDPNSANSQFFICFGPACRQLTGQYTLWGEVIEGMDNVDKIARGEPPPQPDRMLKVYVLADKK
jgi:cyclophilin family peptidyl-prolyl cis-trans isomerase